MSSTNHPPQAFLHPGHIIWSLRTEGRLTCFPGSSVSLLFVYTSPCSSAPTLSGHSNGSYYIRRCGNQPHKTAEVWNTINVLLHFQWDVIVYGSVSQNSPQMSKHQGAHQLCIIHSGPEKTGGTFLMTSWTHSWYTDLWGILKCCPVSYDSNTWITRLDFYLSPKYHTTPFLISPRKTANWFLFPLVENVTINHRHSKYTKAYWIRAHAAVCGLFPGFNWFTFCCVISSIQTILLPVSVRILYYNQYSLYKTLNPIFLSIVGMYRSCVIKTIFIPLCLM